MLALEPVLERVVGVLEPELVEHVASFVCEIVFVVEYALVLVAVGGRAGGAVVVVAGVKVEEEAGVERGSCHLRLTRQVESDSCRRHRHLLPHLGGHYTRHR